MDVTCDRYSQTDTKDCTLPTASFSPTNEIDTSMQTSTMNSNQHQEDSDNSGLIIGITVGVVVVVCLLAVIVIYRLMKRHYSNRSSVILTLPDGVQVSVARPTGNNPINISLGDYLNNNTEGATEATPTVEHTETTVQDNSSEANKPLTQSKHDIADPLSEDPQHVPEELPEDPDYDLVDTRKIGLADGKKVSVARPTENNPINISLGDYLNNNTEGATEAPTVEHIETTKPDKTSHTERSNSTEKSGRMAKNNDSRKPPIPPKKKDQDRSCSLGTRTVGEMTKSDKSEDPLYDDVDLADPPYGDVAYVQAIKPTAERKKEESQEEYIPEEREEDLYDRLDTLKMVKLKSPDKSDA